MHLYEFEEDAIELVAVNLKVDSGKWVQVHTKVFYPVEDAVEMQVWQRLEDLVDGTT